MLLFLVCFILHLSNNTISSFYFIELKPRLAAKYIPGLPAYILFMCIRYIDFVDDEAHVAGFLSTVTKKIKKVPRVRRINKPIVSFLS
jgi:myosin-5